MARKQRQRTLRSPIPTVIGEGKTECYYFKGLREVKGYRMKVSDGNFRYPNIKDLEKPIQKVLDEEGTAIVVFDTDVAQRDQGAKKRMENLRHKYAKNGNVVFCDSFPSIEFWFLLHYKEAGRPYGRCEEVVKELREFMPKFNKHTTFLQKKDWVEALCSGEKMAEAIRRSKQLEDYTKPYSKVYQAIEFLEERKRQEVK